MSRSKKTWAGIQLGLALLYLSWLFLAPYLTNIVVKNTHASLYEMALEKKELFNMLGPTDQAELLDGYRSLADAAQPSYMKSLKKSVLEEGSLFAFFWLLFAFLISLSILRDIPYAEKVAWILPLLLLCYACSLPYQKRAEPAFFPKEEYILSHYSEKDASSKTTKEDLLKGWHHYLITEWAEESPSATPEVFEKQLDKGLFTFNVARLKWVKQGGSQDVLLVGLQNKPSLLKVAIYFLWNLIFAWAVNRQSKSKAKSAPDLSEAL